MLSPRSLIAAALALLTPVAASAETVLGHVRAPVEVLKVSDFFPQAGNSGRVPIFRAPDLGQTGEIDAQLVVQAAHQAGYLEAEAGRVRTVTVTRLALELTDDIVHDLVEQAIRDRFSIPEANDVDLRFNRHFETVLADPAVSMPYQVTNLRSSDRNPAFQAIVEVAGAFGTERIPVSGTALEMVEVVMLNKPMRRGDVITDEDLVRDTLPKLRMPTEMLDADEIVGMAATRTLSRGSVVSPSDVREPVLVERGDRVMILYTDGSLVLSVVGEALSNGARGDTVRVLNKQSRRMLEGVVTQAGTVDVSPLKTTVVSSLERPQ